MSAIHGLAVHAAGAALLPYKYEAGELGDDEVEVQISHCGICASDVHLINNDWGSSRYPFIPGHEIIGTVTAVGGRVKARTAGERVGIGWQANSCGICEWCLKRRSAAVRENPAYLRRPQRRLCGGGPRELALCGADSGGARK